MEKVRLEDIQFIRLDDGLVSTTDFNNGHNMILVKIDGSKYYSISSTVIKSARHMQSKRQVKDHLAYLQKLPTFKG
jgi:hypothetical protein